MLRRAAIGLCVLFAGGAAFFDSGAVAAAARGEDAVPLTPSTRIVPVAGGAGPVLRLDVAGPAGTPFTLVYVFRRPDGVPLIDPDTNLPCVGVLPGLAVPSGGTWSQSFAMSALTFGLPDYDIEVLAVPVFPPPGGGVLLSWKSALRNVFVGPADPAPPAVAEAWTTVPGLSGQFPVSVVSFADPTIAGLYHLAENGPGGVYPIG